MALHPVEVTDPGTVGVEIAVAAPSQNPLHVRVRLTFPTRFLADQLIELSLSRERVENAGEANLVLGAEQTPERFFISDINGDNGVVLRGFADLGNAGASVASAGDFNGDGLSDVIAGSTGVDSNARSAYVVMGRYITGISLGATAASCPGTAQVRSKGLTANSQVEVYRGTGRGSSIVGAGSCTGTELQLADAQLVGTVQSSNIGQWLLSVDIAMPGLCGTHLQVLDLGTCNESNVTRLPLADS